jgi:hypothetical protein
MGEYPRKRLSLNYRKMSRGFRGVQRAVEV